MLLLLLRFFYAASSSSLIYAAFFYAKKEEEINQNNPWVLSKNLPNRIDAIFERKLVFNRNRECQKKRRDQSK